MLGGTNRVARRGVSHGCPTVNAYNQTFRFRYSCSSIQGERAWPMGFYFFYTPLFFRVVFFTVVTSTQAAEEKVQLVKYLTYS
jgi:hypothetical protein